MGCHSGIASQATTPYFIRSVQQFDLFVLDVATMVVGHKGKMQLINALVGYCSVRHRVLVHPILDLACPYEAMMLSLGVENQKVQLVKTWACRNGVAPHLLQSEMNRFEYLYQKRVGRWNEKKMHSGQ